MLHSVNTNSENNTEMSVLERRRIRLKWQQEQLIQHQPITCFNENEQLDYAFSGFNGDQGLVEFLMGGALKPDPGMETGLHESVLSYGNGSELEMGSYAIPRTVSCPPNVAAAVANMAQELAHSSGAAPSQSTKKRKTDKTQYLKVTAKKSEDKKMKGCKEEESKSTEQISSSKSTTSVVTNNKNTKGTSANNTKDNSKTSENPKPDYIHVRARRGQATDSHSLAERVRREKISERMKFLQDLVPGCNKITGKAGMLDEIINYVQSLQRQVEFLSMKLAVINPRDFDVDNYLVKEMYTGCTSSNMVDHNHASIQFDALGQGVLSSSLEMVINPMDGTLRRTISAPVSIPHSFLDSSSLNQMQQLTWEDEIQNLYNMEYQQGQSASFISQPFTGLLEASHVKKEM
ncbi:hypothetical protein CASFOL_036159 [Castilleja foliolosa]|uniref:BHLH domain-containing protein n=1 Tax=Castilleja foliolosa TaxID=1961234 RepID=A0ABD3BVF7_9LAMI